MNNSVTVVGAGLAGCEAALQLVQNGYNVTLYDAKPKYLLPAYSLSGFAELVCNNAVSSYNTDSPLGLLNVELNKMGSRLIEIAQSCRIDDNRFFSIDKKRFTSMVTKEIQNSGICIVNRAVTELPKDETVIVASGPLTNEQIVRSVVSRLGVKGFFFSDASCAIVDIKSIDLSSKYIKRITGDLYTVEIPEDVFDEFWFRLVNARQCNDSGLPDVEFEKCHSIEKLASIGKEALSQARFTYPYQEGNCLLLRRENGLEDGYIMVGCMTTICHADQRAAFSVFPGFQKMRLVKYGRMHRNTFFDSPRFMDSFYKVKKEDIYIIGQLSGIDGYLPAISSGLVSALRIIHGKKMKPFPRETMIGALAHYVSNEEVSDYQPMCASYSLLKRNKKMGFYEASMSTLDEYKKSLAC